MRQAHVNYDFTLRSTVLFVAIILKENDLITVTLNS